MELVANSYLVVCLFYSHSAGCHSGARFSTICYLSPFQQQTVSRAYEHSIYVLFARLLCSGKAINVWNGNALTNSVLLKVCIAQSLAEAGPALLVMAGAWR